MRAFVASSLAAIGAGGTLDRMPNHRRTRELALWGLTAFAAGIVAGATDLSAREVQGPALLLMLAAFAATLPGRMPVWLAAVCTALGLPAAHIAAGDGVSVGMLIVVIPTGIAAAGGSLVGRLLGTAATSLDESAPRGGQSAAGALSTRTLLGTALVAICLAGIAPVAASLRAVGHPFALWLATVWQVMTLVGWVGVTPFFLVMRPSLEPAFQNADGNGGLRARDIASHAAVVVSGALAHAAIVVALTAMLLIPIRPSAAALFAAAVGVYLPLDFLAYLAIITLGWASDAKRHQRKAAEREQVLRAEAVGHRLSALRARLNPHFLFNAMNGAAVLTRTGRTDDATALIEGITALLRYVLDDSRPTVPVRDELEFSRQYLAVQHARFGDRLQFEVAAADDVADAMVPQLLLQPIVENAVDHGVAGNLAGGWVRVSAARDGESVRFVIEDDGPGASAANTQRGIGLSNTRDRLTHSYGNAASLAISPRQPVGTRVDLVVPFVSDSQTVPHGIGV